MAKRPPNKIKTGSMENFDEYVANYEVGKAVYKNSPEELAAYNHQNSKHNLYIEFIMYLTTKNYVGFDRRNMQVHRINPGHQDGIYEDSNSLYIDIYDHFLAHLYRFWQYQDSRDQGAANMILSNIKKMRKFGLTYTELIAKFIKDKRSEDSSPVDESNPVDPAYQTKLANETFTSRRERMIYLNKDMDEKYPGLRSRAGKIGGKVFAIRSRTLGTGFFNATDNFPIQRMGNFTKNGSFIKEYRKVPYAQLHPDWIDYIYAVWPYQYDRCVHTLAEYRMVIQYQILTNEEFLLCREELGLEVLENAKITYSKAILFLEEGEMLV